MFEVIFGCLLERKHQHELSFKCLWWPWKVLIDEYYYHVEVWGWSEHTAFSPFTLFHSPSSHSTLSSFFTSPLHITRPFLVCMSSYTIAIIVDTSFKSNILQLNEIKLFLHFRMAQNLYSPVGDLPTRKSDCGKALGSWPWHFVSHPHINMLSLCHISHLLTLHRLH